MRREFKSILKLVTSVFSIAENSPSCKPKVYTPVFIIFIFQEKLLK